MLLPYGQANDVIAQLGGLDPSAERLIKVLSSQVVTRSTARAAADDPEPFWETRFGGPRAPNPSTEFGRADGSYRGLGS